MYLFIQFWLHWAFIPVRELSLVAGSGGYSLSWCVDFSLNWFLLQWSTGSREWASVAVLHGFHCSTDMQDFPRSEIEPMSPALGRQVAICCTTREVQLSFASSSIFPYDTTETLTNRDPKTSEETISHSTHCKIPRATC